MIMGDHTQFNQLTTYNSYTINVYCFRFFDWTRAQSPV